MEQNSSQSLVAQRTSGAIETAGSGPQRVLSEMVSDALLVARRKEREIAQPGLWIGNQEFRDADYRQITNWAEALGMRPEALLKQLMSTISSDQTDCRQFKIVDSPI